MRIEKLLPGVQKNVLLKNYTTFRIGGPAKYFFVAATKEDLIKAISVAKKLKLPFFILGGGSNLLVADEGYKGLVIKIKNQKSKIKSTNQKSKIIEAESGALLSQIVSLAVKNNLSGLEWAAGIPGTFGGAIRGNAGSFGRSMKDVVKTVTVLKVGSTKSEVRKYKKKDCKFSYRESVFKKKPNLIILSAEIQLKKGKKREIQSKIKEYLNYRKETQPLNFPSVGSVFKNPIGKSAGFLIENCGLKGKRIGNVKISDIHANFIVNLGNGKAKDVKKLINLAKKKVKNKFGIDLKEEIQYLGLF
jgi:UDP-N-acetylmuramate dehydrogenase